MATFLQVDPERLVDQTNHVPLHGRGAWTKEGIGFDYRPRLNPLGYPRIGTVAEKSLAHWAVAAGVAAIQRRLSAFGFMAPLPDDELGVFGPKTSQGVQAFQSDNADPASGGALWVDGIVGSSDSRALWTPEIDMAEDRYGIPDHLLRGEVNHESAMDAGAIGYIIYYAKIIGTQTTYQYRGVDRGLCQINSVAHSEVSWRDAMDPTVSIPWSGASLRAHYDQFKKWYPQQLTSVLWDAAVCAHNNPAAATNWARYGSAPTEAAALYVGYVKTARY